MRGELSVRIHRDEIELDAGYTILDARILFENQVSRFEFHIKKNKIIKKLKISLTKKIGWKHANIRISKSED